MAEEIRYAQLAEVNPQNIHLMQLFPLYRKLMDYDYQFIKDKVSLTTDRREQLLTEAFLSIDKLVLAYAGDRMVGFVATSTNDPQSISEMFVEEEYRRQLIGQRLFAMLKSMVKGPLKVNSVWGNEASAKFYQSLGFIPVTVGMTEVN